MQNAPGPVFHNVKSCIVFRTKWCMEREALAVVVVAAADSAGAVDFLLPPLRFSPTTTHIHVTAGERTAIFRGFVFVAVAVDNPFKFAF